jgi:gliding motility-associated-like protein
VTSGIVPIGSITPILPDVKCRGEATPLTASGGTFYQWYRDDSLIVGANSAVYPATLAGSYSVIISNGVCSAPASNVVAVRFKPCAITLPDTEVFVPTAFTPDGNGKNDLLQPYFINIRELVYFKVYNRWGQQVYQTKEIGQGWNGTIRGVQQPVETYSWVLECVDFSGKTIRQSGRSLLIR